jgi:hypothetical protein
MACEVKPKFECSRQIFEKNTQISNFMKIRPLEVKFFHPDRRKDMTKLIVAFHNFVNAPKSVKI